MADSTAKFRAVFFGKVLPERAIIDFGRPFKIGFRLAGHNDPASAEIYINLNQVTVNVESVEDIEDRATLKNVVEDLVRHLLDFFGYVHGHGYDVDIIAGYFEQANENEIFGISGYLFSEKERNQRHNLLSSALRHIDSPYVTSALADLREAIRMPVETGFFAKRAIESVMQAFKEEATAEDEDTAWEKMRSNLNFDKDWLQKLNSVADDRRHGKPTLISWDQRLDAMKRAWLVLDRYFEYLNRGKNPLPKAEFPIPQ